MVFDISGHHVWLHLQFCQRLSKECLLLVWGGGCYPHCRLYPLKSDQQQFPSNNIHTSSIEKLVRTFNITTQGRMLWTVIKFSPLILKENVWISVWRISMQILGLKELTWHDYDETRGRVRTLFISSNSMTFHDFFHGLFQFSMTLGRAVTLKNFHKYPCFRAFFDQIHSTTGYTLVSTKMCAIWTV